MARKAPSDYVLHWNTHWSRYCPAWYRAQVVVAPRSKEHPQGEYRFAKPRRWVFDWCVPEARVAVEIDGGNRMVRYTKTGQPVAVGRHTQGRDYEKLNAAAERGWLVFRLTPEMMDRDPEHWVQVVARTILRRLQSEQGSAPANTRRTSF